MNSFDTTNEKENTMHKDSEDVFLLDAVSKRVLHFAHDDTFEKKKKKKKETIVKQKLKQPVFVGGKKSSL
jgi:hypothetical protein